MLPALLKLKYASPGSSKVQFNSIYQHRHASGWRPGAYDEYVYLFANREYLYSNMCKFSLGVLVDSELGVKQAVESYQQNPSKFYPLPYTVPDYILDYEKIDVNSKYALPSDW